MKKISTVLGEREIEQKLKAHPAWQLKNRALVRTETFLTYLLALKFVNKLGHLAEKNDHHPDIEIKYKTVSIRFSTHSMGGVTPLDFKSVIQTDALIKTMTKAKSHRSRGEPPKAPAKN